LYFIHHLLVPAFNLVLSLTFFIIQLLAQARSV